MDKLTQAFQFRHACKMFDETKKISQTDIEYILEAGRTSPSSFGIEPWHFLVISNDKIKNELKSVCYNQNQISSCSHLVVVLYRKAEQFTMQSEYLRRTINRVLPEDAASFDLDAACQYFINYCNNGLPEGTSVNNWSELQSYLPCANMLTAAAYIGIDSCAIGGIEYNNFVQVLEKLIPQFSKNSFGVSLCLAFGYRQNIEQPKQIRWDSADVVTFVD